MKKISPIWLIVAVVLTCALTVLLMKSDLLTKSEPEAEPTPTAEITAEPTQEPTATPTQEPTATLTAEPTQEPTASPTPTATPTPAPTKTIKPTQSPTATPTPSPTKRTYHYQTRQPTPTPVPTDGIAIPGWASITLPAGELEADVLLNNPAANTDRYYLSFELRMKENDDVVFTTGLVPGGMCCTHVQLNFALEAGTYDAIMRVQPYTVNGQNPTNNANVAITLIVE